MYRWDVDVDVACRAGTQAPTRHERVEARRGLRVVATPGRGSRFAVAGDSPDSWERRVT